MSFDLYFVQRPPAGARWGQVMDNLEAAAAEQRRPSAEDEELWSCIIESVSPIMPGASATEGDRWRQLDDGVIVQLMMSPGEISITTPYWFEGDEAECVVNTLREVAAAVEGVTGLVAYDAQAGAAFLGPGGHDAATTLDRLSGFIRTEVSVKRPDRPKWSRWAFWQR